MRNVSPPGERLGRPTARRLIFSRRRDVAVQQRRREIADRHVVEAVARFVGGSSDGDVDVERQQIANGVLVFGAGQAAERVGAARVRAQAAAARSSAVSSDAIAAL